MGTSEIRRRQDNGEDVKEESDVVTQTQAQVFRLSTGTEKGTSYLILSISLIYRI